MNSLNGKDAEMEKSYAKPRFIVSMDRENTFLNI